MTNKKIKYEYESYISYDEIIKEKRKEYLRNPMLIIILIVGIILLATSFAFLINNNIEDILGLFFLPIAGAIFVYMWLSTYLNIPKDVKNNPTIKEGKFKYEFYDDFFLYDDGEVDKVYYDKIVNYKEDNNYIYITSKPNDDLYRRVDTFEKINCPHGLIVFLEQFKGRNDKEALDRESKELRSYLPKQTNINTTPKFEMYVRLISGILCSGFSIIYTLFNGFKQEDVLIVLFTFIIGAFLLFSYIRDKNKDKEALELKYILDQYYDIWDKEEEKNIEFLSKQIKKSYDETLIYVNLMLANNYYPGWYLDLEHKRIMKGKDLLEKEKKDETNRKN